MTKEEITTSETFSSLVSEITTTNPTIVKFTPEQVTQVEQVQTVFGNNYQITVKSPEGNTTITVLKPVNDQPIRIIGLELPTQLVEPAKPVVSTTSTVDTTTGQQIVKTNDTKVIEKNPSVISVVVELKKTESIPVDSHVTSAVIRTSEQSEYTTLVVESTTQDYVVIAKVDSQTNQVVIMGQKPVTNEEVKEVKNTGVVHLTEETVIPQDYFTQTTVTKDEKIVQIVEDVRQVTPSVG